MQLSCPVTSDGSLREKQECLLCRLSLGDLDYLAGLLIAVNAQYNTYSNGIIRAASVLRYNLNIHHHIMHKQDHVNHNTSTRDSSTPRNLPGNPLT